MSVVSEPGYKEKVTYAHQPKSFTGTILYHTLQGRPVVAQRFKNGAVIGVGTPTVKSKFSNPKFYQGSVATAEAEALNCQVYDVYQITTGCTPGIPEMPCSIRYDYAYSIIYCYAAAVPPPSNNPPPTEGGGLGVPNDPVPCVPQGASIGPVVMRLGYGVNVVNSDDPNPPVPVEPDQPGIPPGAPNPGTLPNGIPVIPCPDPISSGPPPIILLEVKIVGLPPCARDIFNALSTQTHDMYDIFRHFYAQPSDGFNWELKMGWLPEANAETTDDKIGNEATTIFDMDKYKEATDLALARTMLHESAHAYLVRYFDTNPAAANKTYAELLEFYDQKGKLEPAHHETFVNTFVQQIAGALSKFGDSKNYKFAQQTKRDNSIKIWHGEDYTQLMPSRPYPPQYR